jgi:hypothetical protein
MLAEYHTSPERAVLGLAAGAATGAYVLTLWSYLSVGHLQDPHHLQATQLFFSLMLFIWTAGLIAVGAPVWWLLHRLGLRHWLVAIATGVVLLALVGLALQSGIEFEDNGSPGVTRLTDEGFYMLVVTGALVALVVWRVAYRRSKPTG